MMVTRIELIDRALVQIGSEPLMSDLAPGAETHLAVYNSIVEDILSTYTWNCSTFIRQLNRNLAPPDIHWKYSYETPAEMLGSPRAVYDRPDCKMPYTVYELFGDRELRTDAEAIWVRFSKLVSPSFWPGYLRQVIELLMMAKLALSVREDKALMKDLLQEVYGPPGQMMQGGKLKAAKDADELARPSPVLGMGANPLTDVRL